MFRAIVKQRSNLDLLPIADMQILSASISEDTTQKATSTINVVEVPSNVFLGDLVGVYTSKGVFIYWGTISAINENKITLQQFNSFYNDTHLLVPQTSNNQKTFFNTKTISNVIELYLKSKELGHQSTLNEMSASLEPTYQGLVDKDVANNYKGITHTIIDNEQTFAPYPQEKESKNLETFLYDMFNTYNRIIRPIINLKVGGGSTQKDYYELEYIQSSRTQYIDTLFKVNGNTRVKGKMQFTSNTGAGGATPFAFGGGYSSENSRFSIFLVGDIVGDYYSYRTGRHYFGIDTLSLLEFDLNKNEWQINDKSYTYTLQSWQSNYNFVLFAINERNGVSSNSDLRIYYFQIYDNDILIRDFVPCIRKSDMAIGLWDKVANEFYGNSGTGTFIGGGIAE